MPETKGTTLGEQIVPSGRLVYLSTGDLIAGKNNPRHLFDEDRLKPLKDDIQEHGVLVPIMVYRPKGQTRYSILDGERRFRCCVELEKQGVTKIKIPANIVDPPDKIAGILFMFAVHNLREEWELMPTALSLKVIMDKLGKTDPSELKALTSLSEPQIERCQVLLQYPEKFQRLSLDPDPKIRIPSNFWIELFPVLKVCEEHLPNLWKKLGRDGIIEKFTEKYRAKKIKSVIHFRKIMEAFQVTEEEGRKDLVHALREFVENTDLETRDTFDKFILDPRRVQTALTACSDFIRVVTRQRIDYSLERADLVKAFEEVRAFAEQMIEKLRGSEDPDVARARE